MNNEDKKVYFLKCLGLDSLGFERVSMDNVGEYVFKKEHKKVSFYLFYDVISNKVNGMGAWVVYEEIEEIIKFYLLKHRINFNDNFPMSISFYKMLPYNQNYSESCNIPLIDEEITSYVGMVMKEYIIEIFTPLWEKYSDLQVINDELIDKIPQMQLAKYISGEMPLKKLIIMRKCKNQNYTEYKNWLMGNYTTAYEQGTEQAEKEYFMLKDLIEYIESVY
jgi:hypothetical protein